MKQAWTFETLAQAGKESLEDILLNGHPPDINRLSGLTYCGWNHDLIGKISGEKFKKGFFKENGQTYGYNETVVQDHQKYLGQWKSSTMHPAQMGFFRVTHIKDEAFSKLYKPYHHLALFNYQVPLNKRHLVFFRVIRDVIAMPNENDHSLLLGKAYLQFSRNFNIFCCYFQLGHPQKSQ